MGTRADFYVGRGKSAEWLGSIAWDGYPTGDKAGIFRSETEEVYRQEVAAFLVREDGTVPSMGWPWPWNDSQTTDYAYAFDCGKVYGSDFGHAWFDPLLPQPDVEVDTNKEEFPDMTEVKNVTWGKRSGVIIMRAG